MLSKPILSRKQHVTHEAGHALLFWHEGFVLSEITVQPDPEANPHTCGYVKASFLDSANLTAVLLHPDSFSSAQVRAIMAGRAAVELYLPNIPTGTGHNSDFRTLEKLMLPDPETVAIIQWGKEHPEATAEDFYKAHKGMVIKILKSKKARRAMKALSEILNKAGTLSGAEAVHVLETAWGDPRPPFALPAECHMALTNHGPKCPGDLLRRLRNYLDLMQHDIKGLRDAGTDKENEQIDKIWKQIILLKVLV